MQSRGDIFLETYRETLHSDGKNVGLINFVVWSDVIRCTNCGYSDTYWNLAVNHKTRYRIKKNEDIVCNECKASFPLNKWERVFTSNYDSILGCLDNQIKINPVLINYTLGSNKYEKTPDDNDYKILNEIWSLQDMSNTFKTLRMPQGDESRRNDNIGIKYTHQFYIKRTLSALRLLWEKSRASYARYNLLFWLQSVGLGFTRLNRYLEASFSQVNRYLKGTLYIAPFSTEVSPRYALKGKINRMQKSFFDKNNSYFFCITTETSTGLSPFLGLNTVLCQ